MWACPRDRRRRHRACGRDQADKDEQAMFDSSVAAVKGLVDACKGIDETLA
jgi:hypothetical protein